MGDTLEDEAAAGTGGATAGFGGSFDGPAFDALDLEIGETLRPDILKFLFTFPLVKVIL
jgi:hypothetical protein